MHTLRSRWMNLEALKSTSSSPKGLASADESSRTAVQQKTMRNIATGVRYELMSRKAIVYSAKHENMSMMSAW